MAKRATRTPRDVDPAAAGDRPDRPMKADWMAMVLEHHAQIRTAFTRALQAPPGGGRLAAFKGLAVLLTGHSIAEEAVLYPVLSNEDLGGADRVYDEQAAAKTGMAALECLDPASDEWTSQLEAIRSAVLEHMAEEETQHFPLIHASGVNQAKLTARYAEEFERYTRTGSVASNAAWAGPPREAAAPGMGTVRPRDEAVR